MVVVDQHPLERLDEFFSGLPSVVIAGGCRRCSAISKVAMEPGARAGSATRRVGDIDSTGAPLPGQGACKRLRASCGGTPWRVARPFILFGELVQTGRS